MDTKYLRAVRNSLSSSSSTRYYIKLVILYCSKELSPAPQAILAK